MKIFFRILKITAVFIIVLIVSLFTVSVFMQDKVAGIILKSFNNQLSTKFSIGATHFSLVRKFPYASLDLRNVIVFSSPQFNKKGFVSINTDTLLTAKTVRAEFSISDIIKGIYVIDKIGIMDGRLILFSDTEGRVNYEISADTGKSNETFSVNLKKISLSNISTTYNNLATRLMIKAIVSEGELKTRISGDNIDFTARGNALVSFFSIYNFKIAKPVFTGIDVNIHKTSRGTLFEKSRIAIDRYKFELAGNISEDNVIDLSLKGSEINIADLKKYVSGKYFEKIADYNPSGLLSFDSKIRGPVSRTKSPEISISFMLSNGSVTYGTSALKLTGLSFSGDFTNGSHRNPETSTLFISSFKGMLGTAGFSGILKLSDFSSLKGDLDISGRIVAPEFSEFFNLKKISSAEGSIDFRLKIRGNIPSKKQYIISDLFKMKPEASLKFNSFGLGIMKDSLKVGNVEGILLVDGLIRTDDIHFDYRNHKIGFKGVVRNLPEWVEGKPVWLSVSGDMTSNEFLPEKLFRGIAPADTTRTFKALNLPDYILLDLKYRIDHFAFKTFSATGVEGMVSYKPKVVNFKSLKLNSMDGEISGNGFIAQNKDKSFVGRVTLGMQKIDIHEAFTEFKNFGQDFIKSENLAGVVSGTCSVLIPMDSLGHPATRSVTAEGKYSIENGNLIDFAPVKELSSFIEVSELENIKFEKLENDFFIRDNTFYLPQMDVRSSAADLTVNGTHSFENNYEYHVKILLSEMLSKKIRKPKPNTTEFGAVKDEGLGRTSILLKIVNKGEDVKVTYDAKAAGNIIKNDIKKEKQTLKTILNQEYGWFKNDTSAAEKPASAEPRFRITWDEADTVKPVEPPATKDEDPVKKLFRKKRVN